MKTQTLFLFSLLSIAGCHPANKASLSLTPDVNPENWPAIQSQVKREPALEQYIAGLVSQMSLEEKVGQMIQAEINHLTPEDVKTYHIGSVLSGGGSFPENNKHAQAKDWVHLADQYYEASTDSSDGNVAIPIIWGIDAVHGNNNSYGTTIFPHNIGLGATRNTELVKRIAQVTAIEVSATGMDWNYAPALAVVRDDRWGRSYEGFGETPEIVRQFAGPIIEGYQGVYGETTFMDESRVIATAKVYLGDGGTHLGKDQGNNISSEQELRDIHSVGFQKALAAGTQSIMAGFNSWQGKKLHGHKGLLTEVLKEKIGFDGIVVSDWNAHEQVEGCHLKACATAINAGVDVMMVPQDWKAFIANTIDQVQNGQIPMSRIDDAVTRILRVKARYGLISESGDVKPKPSQRKFAGKQQLLGQEEHRLLARQAVRESLVLLKNDDQTLPIDPRKKILLLGDGANNIGKQCGGWTLSWQGTGNKNADFPNGDSVYSALKKQVEAAGGQLILAEKGNFNSDLAPDVAVMVYGEDPYAEFVGDRNTLIYDDRSDKNLKLLQQLKHSNIPVVSLFISGRPLWVNPYLNLSHAFVAAWLPGTEASGIADVLLRDKHGQIQYDFHGKLSFSWPKTTTQFQLNHDTQPYDPLFAYGYGLNYQSAASLPLLDENIDEVSQRLKQSDYAYNDGQTYLPWLLYIATNEEKAHEVIGYLSESDDKSLSVRLVDKNRQGDSIQVNWQQPGRMYFDAFEIVPTTIDHAVLNIEARVDKKPEGDIRFDIQCGDDCGLSYPLQEFRQATTSEWQNYHIPLSCFKAEGTVQNQLKRMTLLSEGKFTLTIHSLSIENRDTPVECTDEKR
ncbi:Beta-glucosidase BoGH3B [Thalassocella blandensis]|nr:Beta-glucosidase BoGH3B [Thalassocella blandensis]